MKLELIIANRTSAIILCGAASLRLMMSASIVSACGWSGDMVLITPPANDQSAAYDASVATVSIADRQMAEPPACRGAGDCDGILVVQVVRVIRNGNGLRGGEQILVPFGTPGCHYAAYPNGEFDVVLRRATSHPMRISSDYSKFYPKLDDETHRSMKAYNIELRFKPAGQ
jgi:hypothetical protein